MHDLLAFAQVAPYTVTKSSILPSAVIVTVSDSGLNAYNTLFQAFDPKDTSRATLYERLPEELLLRLPISTIEPATYRTSGDTLIAQVPFQRPVYRTFTIKLYSLLMSYDSTKPLEDFRAQFPGALRRIRNELQEADTLTVSVVHGPRIIRFATARSIRDSLAFDSLLRSSKAALQGLIPSARLSLREFHDYSGSKTIGVDGASIEGTVTPTAADWFTSPNLYITYRIQCIGFKGADTVWQDAFLLQSETVGRRPVDFLCLWFGQGAKAWSRLHPDFVDARLIARVGRDSVIGPWALKR